MTAPSDLPQECQAVAEQLPELALGVLPGRERAAALAHLDTCMRCRAEVARLSQAADSVLRATPRIEPPAGFEERVAAEMARRGGKRRVTQQRHQVPRRRRVLSLAAAAAVVALAVPLGLSLSESATPPVAQADSGLHSSAALVSDGRVLGHVSTFYSHGHQPAWLSMTLSDAGGTGEVKCQVLVRSGSAVTVGTFWIDDGTGHWDSALPMSPDDVTGARVIAADSSVLATARFG